MRANIARGRLIAPKTLGDGLVRSKQLAFECRRIEEQIAVRTDGTAEWRQSAERALKLFRLELRLLDEWVSVRQADSERLLREAFEVLKVLEIETDFKPHETELMEKLDEFFVTKQEEKQEATTAT